MLLEPTPEGHISHCHGPDSRCTQTLCGKPNKDMWPGDATLAVDCPECNRLWEELKEAKQTSGS